MSSKQSTGPLVSMLHIDCDYVDTPHAYASKSGEKKPEAVDDQRSAQEISGLLLSVFHSKPGLTKPQRLHNEHNNKAVTGSYPTTAKITSHSHETEASISAVHDATSNTEKQRG